MAAGFTFIKSGYNFSLAGTPLAGAPATCNGLAAGVGLARLRGGRRSARSAGQQCPRFFGTNSDGVIYEHTATLALTMPESSARPAGAPIQ